MSFVRCKMIVKHSAICELMDRWLARIRERRSAQFTFVRPHFPLYRAHDEPSVLMGKVLRERGFLSDHKRATPLNYRRTA